MNLPWRKPGNTTAVKGPGTPRYQLGVCTPVLDPESKTLHMFPLKLRETKHKHRTAAIPSTPPVSRHKPGLPQGQGKNTRACSPSNPTRFRAHQSLLLQIHCSSSHSLSSLGHAGTPLQHQVMQSYRSLFMSCKSMLTPLLCETPKWSFVS